MRVVSFTLINAATDQPIAAHDPLTDGAVLSYAKLGTSQLNIRANVEGDVRCVLFDVDRKKGPFLESIPPYALAGDKDGDYYDWKTKDGPHTVTATPTAQVNGKGLKGKSCTVSFTIAP